MSRNTIISLAATALAAAFVAAPAMASPAVPGKMAISGAGDAVQTVNYGGYQRGHNRGFFGGGHGRRWSNYGGWRRNYGGGHGRRWGYSQGYGQGGGHGGRY